MALEVQTAHGPVRGKVTRKRIGKEAREDGRPIREWLSIPYARAERWKLPEDPPQWKEALDCSAFRTGFPDQGSALDQIYAKKERWDPRAIPQDEHSHYVSVWAPARRSIRFSSSSDVLQEQAQLLPVLVWLHGGALYFGGSSSHGIYSPVELIRKAEADGSPIVVVSVQYRLSILGWLANQDLLEADGRAGNLGLYDTIKALEWIQQNIAAFGGDADRVTIVGESAGANIAHCLFRTGKKLFQRAILMSGAAGSLIERPVSNDDFPGYEQLLKELGITAQTPKERIEALRKVPWKELVDKAFAVTPVYTGLWHAVVERTPGAIFNKSTINAIKAGDHDPWIKEVIFGLMKDEGTIFNAGFQVWSETNLDSLLRRRGLEADKAALASHYSLDAPSKYLSNLPSLGGTHLVSDLLFVGPAVLAARDLSSRPNKHSGKRVKVFVYRMDVIPSHLHEGMGRLGICHTGDIPFLFNNASLWAFDGTCDDAKVANAYLKRILAFVHSGKPDDKWPTFENGELLVFEDKGDVSEDSISHWRGERLEVSIAATVKAMDRLDAPAKSGKL